MISAGLAERINRWVVWLALFAAAVVILYIWQSHRT
jgi:hypothetical protein